MKNVKKDRFDRDFLKESVKIYKINWKPGHKTIDLHSLFYSHQILTIFGLKLSFLPKVYQIKK